jgi:hypothetical protein
MYVSPKHPKPTDVRFIIKQEAIISPNRGVQVKELKVEKHEKTLSMEEELVEGKRQLSRIRGFCWFFIVVFSVILIGVI